MPNNEIVVAEVFRKIFESNVNDIILKSGRNGGKSKTVYILAGVSAAQYPNEDIIIARASYGSIADSSYNEMVEVIEGIDSFRGVYEYRKSPLRIVRKGGGTNIYFMGVGGSKERTKGIKPKHKVSMVILEEAQELKSREHYDQTLASLRRRFGEHCKVVTVFNPPAQELHWINVWAKAKETDLDYLVVTSSWMDIMPFLQDRDIKEILKIKLENKVYYDYIYMGIPCGSEGACYPMFRQDKHIISPSQLNKVFNYGVRIAMCIIGGDGAVTRDSTAFTCKLILTNGCCVNTRKFIHNPKIDGSLSYHQLVSQYLVKWINEVINEFHLGTIDDYYKGKERGINITLVPMYMRIDSAAPDLIRECQFHFSNRINVGAIHKKTIMEMVGVCQSAIGGDYEYIVDYGGYFDYVLNRFIQTKIDPLAEQISMLIWNEQQTGYDPIVPNDICDSWTYGTFFWYGNIENIHSFDILRQSGVKFPKICDILISENKGES